MHCHFGSRVETSRPACEFEGLRPVQSRASDWGMLPERQPAKRKRKGARTSSLSVHFSSLEDIYWYNLYMRDIHIYI